MNSVEMFGLEIPADRYLGVHYREASKEKVVATMLIEKKHTQPFGILHGGLNVYLAESVASVGSATYLDLSKYVGVGLEINANHVSSGIVGDTLVATGVPLQTGKRNQVWSVEIRSEKTGDLICISRCTIAVIPLTKQDGSSRAAPNVFANAKL